MSETKQVSSSIVYKLNTWHLSQVFLSFIWVNMIILLLFTALLWLRAERVTAALAKTMPAAEYILRTEPDGFRFPGYSSFIFPDHLQNGVRQILTERESGAFWQQLESARYRVWVRVPDGVGFYAVDYAIGEQLIVFLPIGIVLLAFELMFLLRSISKGASATRTALQPIADLTLSTKNIKTKQVQPDLQLRDLTGRIDNIDAFELDSRISIRSEQSELTDLAEAINGMLERLNNAYRSQVRFVSDASHELRTPIAVIQGYANLLDRWGKNDEKALLESIAAIKSEAENMKNLVEQLLFLARGDNDSMQLAVQKIDLSELAADTIRETGMIDPHHLFQSKIEANVCTIGDLQLLKQALRIFIDNSVKYTPHGGSITVKTLSEGEFAKVIIQDEGIGISPEDLPYVFDRFFRSDDSRARKTGGTGLGLTLAKWIIDRHKGSVEIISRQDIGTRVIISLVRSKQNKA